MADSPWVDGKNRLGKYKPTFLAKGKLNKTYFAQNQVNISGQQTENK